MFFLALIWAAFAPLSILAMAWGLVHLVRSSGQPAALARARPARRFLTVLVLVSLPVAGLWWLDYWDFQSVCEAPQQGRLLPGDRVAGIYLNDPTANSFGTRYLYDEKFDWMEAQDYRDRSRWVRYERGANGAINTVLIPAITARYEVRAGFEQPSRHASVTRTLVVDRANGTVLASSILANFDGGRANALLGAWGTATCPSPGSPAWSDAYHLAHRTLHPGEP